MTLASKQESILRQLQVPESETAKSVRADYRQRLLTFTPAQYFCKPILLSPIICARYGWQCRNVDLLVCASCSKACSVVFPAVLSLEAEAKLCHYYETQLVEAHDECCTFRNEMKAYLRELTAEPPKRTIPLAFASVLPVQQLQLLEAQHPRHVFQRLCESYAKLLQSKRNGTLALPTIKLPANVDNFQSHDESTTETSLLSRIEKTLIKPADESIPASIITIAIALVLFGWMPVNEKAHDGSTDNDDASLIVRTECSFCFSTFDLHETDVNDYDDRNNKGRKTLSPVDAHSYYCPYVCGFQKQPPLWESLASKLLTVPETQSVETAYLTSHGILRRALSPKFRSALHRSTDNGNHG